MKPQSPPQPPTKSQPITNKAQRHTTKNRNFYCVCLNNEIRCEIIWRDSLNKITQQSIPEPPAAVVCPPLSALTLIVTASHCG
mmetsp:Transcript_28932/g.53429  ORF Transcript_28932/g.53429 Transcript_28932/m.53429 type:complete len:83 (+) Transcript_28932:505-753(+)